MKTDVGADLTYYAIYTEMLGCESISTFLNLTPDA